MEQIHGHEVLQMMEGKSFSRQSLLEAITSRWGKDQLFMTCSAEGMTAEQLIDFLEAKGKFMPTDQGFTVDISKRCNH